MTDRPPRARGSGARHGWAGKGGYRGGILYVLHGACFLSHLHVYATIVCSMYALCSSPSASRRPCAHVHIVGVRVYLRLVTELTEYHMIRILKLYYLLWLDYGEVDNEMRLFFVIIWSYFSEMGNSFYSACHAYAV